MTLFPDTSATGKIGQERPRRPDGAGEALNPGGEPVDGEAEETKGDLGGNHSGKLPSLR